MEIIDNINGTDVLIGRKSKYQEIVNIFNDFENNSFEGDSLLDLLKYSHNSCMIIL